MEKISNSSLKKMPLKSSREEAYYWKGWFDAFRKLRFILNSNPKRDENVEYKKGWTGAFETIRETECLLYDELLASIPAKDIGTFVTTNILPQKENKPDDLIEYLTGITPDLIGKGKQNEQRIEPETSISTPGYNLYKLGEGLWIISKKKEEE